MCKSITSLGLTKQKVRAIMKLIEILTARRGDFFLQGGGTYMLQFLLVLGIISMIVAIAVAVQMATRAGRNVVGWVIIIIFFGWIGVLMLYLLEEKRTRSPSSRKMWSYRQADKVKLCPNCGDVLGKKPVCDMCGYINRNSIPSSPQSSIKKNYLHEKKVPQYKCAECGEMIDTLRCPFCGASKK